MINKKSDKRVIKNYKHFEIKINMKSLEIKHNFFLNCFVKIKLSKFVLLLYFGVYSILLKVKYL
jgi:hypothetical protein